MQFSNGALNTFVFLGGGATMPQQFLVPDVDFVPVRQALSGGDLALYRYIQAPSNNVGYRQYIILGNTVLH